MMGARLMETTTMNQQTFEAELKRDGYDVITNTTPGAKVNPEHSHPFDVRAMVLKGDFKLTRDGKTRLSGRRGLRHAAAACTTKATVPKAPWSCSAEKCDAAQRSITRESDEGTGARLAVARWRSFCRSFSWPA